MHAKSLFRHHEALYSTQYRELKERSLTAGALLAGTPGTLHQRNGTGYAYCYRIFYPVPGIQAETLVGRPDDKTAISAMRQRMELAEWSGRQVTALRKGGFQVADKRFARLLVELHNQGTFSAGMVVLGEYAVQAWLNELGVRVRPQGPSAPAIATLELGAQPSFFVSPEASRLPFCRLDDGYSTGVRLAGLGDLRISLGIPETQADNGSVVACGDWLVHPTPHYDYLLDTPESAAMLAGNHCVPVLLPQAARLVWHRLSCCTRSAAPEQMARPRLLALSLAAALLEADPWTLLTAWEQAPPTLTDPIRLERKTLIDEVFAHSDLRDLLADCLR